MLTRTICPQTEDKEDDAGYKRHVYSNPLMRRVKSDTLNRYLNSLRKEETAKYKEQEHEDAQTIKRKAAAHAAAENVIL